MHATMTSKGQITVPKSVRDRLHLSAGDKVEFMVDEDGTVCLIPVTSTVRQLKGMIRKPDKVVSLEEMDAAISKGASGR